MNVIKQVNDARTDGSTISTDQSNHELMSIFADISRHADLTFDESEHCLSEIFGLHGPLVIRDAEQWLY